MNTYQTTNSQARNANVWARARSRSDYWQFEVGKSNHANNTLLADVLFSVSPIRAGDEVISGVLL